MKSKTFFWKKQIKHLVLGGLFIGFWLTLGTFGYHFIGDLPWIDAFLDACMIGSGMGPVNILATNAAKLFSGIYAVLSGIVFITNIGIVFAPTAHRLFVSLHLEA
ncbi:MAG: hypothetical protein MUE53_03895 [Chitinophagales bacterium]|nr:hypothetical protein [Chitinophagales bacterium]